MTPDQPQVLPAVRPLRGAPGPRVLITGAAGFLGDAVARQLANEWHAVALLREGSPALPGAIFSRAFTSIGALLADDASFDAVLHLAARIPRGSLSETSEASDTSPPGDLDRVNVGLVAELVAAYPDARHVLASTVSVYGMPRALPLTAETTPRPVSAYGRSKLAAEAIVRRAPHHAVIRFSSLIGAGMRPGSFIPTIVAAARAGRIHLLGDGARQQNYLDIEDAASMCLVALRAGNSLLALGVGPRSYSNLEVAEILAALTGADIVHAGVDPSPSFVYSSDDSATLGPARINIADSLRRMIEA